MAKGNTMTRFSVADLEKSDRRASRTDMARLRRMTEAELEQQVAADPDWNDVPKDWHLRAEAGMQQRAVATRRA